MFFLVGISISVFLLFLLLIKRNKSSADKVLLWWLLLLFIHQLFYYFVATGQLLQHPHFLGIDFAMPILHGVLLYIYALEITGKKLRKKWYYLLHFVPAILLILLAIPFYSLSGPEKIKVFENGGADYLWYIITQNSMFFISGITYSILTFLLVKKYQQNIHENFSNTDKKELQWLKYLALGLGIIWFVVIFTTNSNFIFYSVVVFVLFIGIFGINQLNIFQQKIIVENTKTSTPSIDLEKLNLEVSTPQKQKRYAKSGLTEMMAEQLYSKLNKLMKEQSLFLQNDITLSQLAKKLDAHPNHLSQVINEKEKKNFYNYINTLRIQHFIHLASMSENQKYTLLSLAYECGFNSKSTFNKHFKENTGKTPREYFKS